MFKFNGNAPSVDNVQNGAYILVSPFGLVWQGELTGSAKNFVDFLRSEKGKEIILKNGTVPVSSL